MLAFVPPPRPPYPPVPDPGQPFDLDAIGRPPAADPRESRLHWWQRSPLVEPTPTVSLRAPLVTLALLPDRDQRAAIGAAVVAAGVPYPVPPRVALVSGLDARDEAMWSPDVREITDRRSPFTVRLVGPELLADRTVCLRVVGRAARDLQARLRAALGDARSVGDDEREPILPMLPLAGTWTGLNRVQLHEVATAVRDELHPPLEFRATALYAFAEADGDGTPFQSFPFGGD